MFGESVFASILDHEGRAANLTNRWISGCWWRRDAVSDEQWLGTKFGLHKCRSVRRKPPGERETGEARGAKWRRFQQYFRLHLRHMTVKNPRCVNKECTRKYSGSELSGLKSAELLDPLHARLPVWGCHTLANAKRFMMLGKRSNSGGGETWRRS